MKYKFPIFTVTAVLFACGNLSAESLPLQSVNKAGEVIDAAIEAEAQAQAICMQTADFERAYRAFVNKEKPDFQGR